MNLINELIKIKNLTSDTLLKVVCDDNTVIIGYYRGYTSAVNNEPEVSQLDIWSDDKQTLYGLTANEIISIDTVSV